MMSEFLLDGKIYLMPLLEYLCGSCLIFLFKFKRWRNFISFFEINYAFLWYNENGLNEKFMICIHIESAL